MAWKAKKVWKLQSAGRIVDDGQTRRQLTSEKVNEPTTERLDVRQSLTKKFGGSPALEIPTGKSKA